MRATFRFDAGLPGNSHFRNYQVILILGIKKESPGADAYTPPPGAQLQT